VQRSAALHATLTLDASACARSALRRHSCQAVAPPTAAAAAAFARRASSCAGSALPPLPPLAPRAHAGAAALPPPPPPDALLMAVPKRKVTPSRKGKRTEGKQLRFAPFVSRCSTCARVKQPHWHCAHCTPGAAPVAPAAPADA
jgi:large subunit ribosomal protein L32